MLCEFHLSYQEFHQQTTFIVPELFTDSLVLAPCSNCTNPVLLAGFEGFHLQWSSYWATIPGVQ